MEESILNTVKQSLPMNPEDTAFDGELILWINSALMRLRQLGVGRKGGYRISDETDTWSEFLNDSESMEMVKSYVSLSVKLMFDASSMTPSVIEAIERQINEIEWCLMVEAETPTTD